MDVKIQNFNSEEKYNIIKEGFTQEYKDVLALQINQHDAPH